MTDFLTAVGVVCAINTLLTILLILADAKLGYGDCRVKINDERVVTVAGGRSLLVALKDERLFIPSACGGRGSCGLCKVAVLEGGGRPLPTETPWLTPEEQRGNVRLSCQVKIRRDLRVRIDAALFNVRQYATEVVELRDLTHDIKFVVLKLVNPPRIDFLAGQFIQLEVPPYALTREPIYRAYSIASDPVETGRIELEIRYSPNGIATTYAHKHLKIGDRVTINGPYGDFHLRPTDAEMLCMAGGSGMAPIRSILLEMARARNPRPCRYFFGARSKRDLFQVDEMRAIEKILPNFRFIPTLSEPKPEDGWTGETGLITQLAEREIRDASRAEAYLCGSPGMIDACIALLRARGILESNIFYDKFA